MKFSPFLNDVDVNKLKDKYVGKVCVNKCQSSGVILENRTFIDCECMVEYKKYLSFLNAGINDRYWNFGYKDLEKKFVKDNTLALRYINAYREKLDKMIEKGVGIYIQGKPGLAKSAIAYLILKEAIAKNYTCYSIRMSKLTNLTCESVNDTEKKDMLDWLINDIDLLLIEEIDKDYKIADTNKWAGKNINEFFGDLYNSRHSLIVTSNIPRNELKGIQADNVIDRLAELIEVSFVGVSYRKFESYLKKMLDEDTTCK